MPGESRAAIRDLGMQALCEVRWIPLLPRLRRDREQDVKALKDLADGR